MLSRWLDGTLAKRPGLPYLRSKARQEHPIAVLCAQNGRPKPIIETLKTQIESPCTYTDTHIPIPSTNARHEQLSQCYRLLLAISPCLPLVLVVSYACNTRACDSSVCEKAYPRCFRMRCTWRTLRMAFWNCSILPNPRQQKLTVICRWARRTSADNPECYTSESPAHDDSSAENTSSWHISTRNLSPNTAPAARAP